MADLATPFAVVIAPDGHVLLVEWLPGAEIDPAFTNLDLRMLVYLEGRMRDLDRTREVAEAAGLTIGATTRLTNGYGIVDCTSSR